MMNSSTPKTSRPRYTMLALLIVLLAFGLRVWMLDSESLWHDEAWSIRAIEGPFTTPDDNTPLLYYLTGHLLWHMGTGDTAFAFRMTSVLLGVLTVGVALWVSRKFAGWRVSLVVGALVAVNPLLWDYSQEVRAYIAIPLIGLVLLYGAWRVLRYSRGEVVPTKLWALVFITELVGIYTHNLGVPLVIWVNVALGGAWLYGRDVRHMLTWAGLQIALIIAYIPWLTTQSPSGTPLNTPPQPGLSLIRDIWASYFLPILPQLQGALAANSGVLTLILLFGVVSAGTVIISAGIVFWRSHKPSLHQPEMPLHAPSIKQGWAFYLLMSHVLLVPALSIGLTLAANIDFHPRYVIVAVPATLMLITFSMDVLTRRWRVIQTSALVFLMIMGGGISAWSLHSITTTRTYQHDDFTTLADYYATLDENTVIIIPFNDEPTLQYAFADRINAQMVNIPLYSEKAVALNTLNTFAGRPVEFLTWFQLPADQRGMYPCLLGALATEINEPFTVFGLSTQRYYLPETLPAFTPITVESPFREVGLMGAGYIAGENAVCLRTTWASNQLFDENLQVAVSLLNPFGDAFIRADAEIARADNVGSSRWTVGEQGEAYHLLTLPEGTPADSYDLLLNVYTANDPTGFDVLDDSGNPAGKNYQPETALSVNSIPANFIRSTLVSPENNGNLQIQTGIPLELTLQIDADSTDMVNVALNGSDWEIVETLNINADQLAWVCLTVPAGNSGEATLTVNQTAVATVDVIDPPRTFDPPDMTITRDVSFDEIARLVGADVPATVAINAPLEVTLVWQALTTTPETSYTVFVQVLADDGRVLAQSDSLPANANRPTISWLEGEYIIDTHTLNWNVTDYVGEATLIAGLYDAENGFQRLTTIDDATFANITDRLQISE